MVNRFKGWFKVKIFRQANAYRFYWEVKNLFHITNMGNPQAICYAFASLLVGITNYDKLGIRRSSKDTGMEFPDHTNSYNSYAYFFSYKALASHFTTLLQYWG